MPETTTAGSADLRHPRRGRHRRTHHHTSLLFAIIPCLSVLAGAGFAVEPLRHPLPAPIVDRHIGTSYRIPGTAPALTWPTTGQATVDIAGVGRIGTSGETTSAPIASVAKVMTAYVILTDRPLGIGEEGPQLTVTEEQARAYPQEAARGESLVPVTAGAVFTERQALQALLLPSANNVARILAAWDAGSVTSFVSRMNATATALGMGDTHYTDPAGYDPGTVSTSNDQVILTRKAMALPAFAEIVGLKKAALPRVGTIKNYNTLIGNDGVVGVKTGSTDEAGGCLSFAATVVVANRELMIVGVILGQPGSDTPQQLSAVFTATVALIRSVGKALVFHTVVRAAQAVATVRGPFDTSTSLAAAQEIGVIGWAGMEVQLSTRIPAVPTRLAAGAELGTVTATAGESAPTSTALRTTDPLVPPNTWTRIKRHR